MRAHDGCLCQLTNWEEVPLKEGATKRRCEIARWGSVMRNAFLRGNGVKKIPIVGTSIFNFERSGVSSS